MNPHRPLPDELKFLQPFVDSLSKLKTDEDVDSTDLVTALRGRYQGLDAGKILAQLRKDRKVLGDWLSSSALDDHPAHWVFGFLSGQGLARSLFRPEQPAPRGPTIVFGSPIGWKVEIGQYELVLKKEKLIAILTSIDESLFRTLPIQLGTPIPEQFRPPSLQQTKKVVDISKGDVKGKKFVIETTAPAYFKSIDYILSVPGGHARVLMHSDGKDFDELPIEERLHTIQIIQP